MRRTPPTTNFLAATDAAFSTATMSSRPYHRGHRRGYSGRSYTGGRDQFVTGDDHLQSVRDANSAIRQGERGSSTNQTQYYQNPPHDPRFRPPQFYYQNPPYNAHPPSQFQNQFYNPRPHPPPQYQNQNQSYNPRPRPYPHQQPHFRQPYDHRREFRPPQNFRPKPQDYREWELALTPPPPHCERFKVLSYNILADYLAMDHWKKLYYHVPPYMLNWQWRKSKIISELGLWSADIMCFQEVDRFDELVEDLKFKGYRGIWKMRTGNPVDGCAIFWRTSRFNLLYEESIEYNKLGLRDNVAQICVLELINQNGSLPPSLTGSRKVVVCNIHVLYNPNRGEIKLGQVRVLLDKAQAVSQLWNNSPIIICGDFNCTPKSPLYNFIAEQKLDLSGIDRNKVSGQASAVIRAPWTYGPNSREKRFANGSVQVTSPEGDKGVRIEQNSSLSDMQNPTTESSNSENQNSSPVLGTSNPTNVQCSGESDTCAGKDTQGAVDHNTVFGEVDGMKEVPNPSNNISRLPTDHININDDEIHDVTPITPSALETVHTDPTGMGSTEHISDAISTSSQESLSKSFNLHDHEGNRHVESDCSPTSLQEGDQTSKVEIDLESTDLNQEVSSNKLSSKTSVSNDKMNCSSTAYLVDESQTPTNFDFTLNEKLEKFSLDDIDKVDVSSGNIGEDAVDFINALHNAEEESNEVKDDLFPSLISKSIDAENNTYNPSSWTPAEIETATGNAESTFLEHPLLLKSTYTEATNSPGTRDPNGEPLVTSYHKCFLGTVDYIWRSEGLQTTGVLAPIPKHVMESSQGYPTKKWGSDHIALVSELAFLEDGTTISKDVV
ncbi:carbon catabolite repressor protein 4 homolog 6 isoform X2 [Vicia villosa]|uniref:carbon catabolite repressor protein 4 homolog 6 isoform X2 n=1 Tax=Vicia villosa TaxID=3911 RepID=UPI00273B6266|nr:carbon catabolite repressor protein 4 homolog 6 isoform X2 [Vicia villosa]